MSRADRSPGAPGEAGTTGRARPAPLPVYAAHLVAILEAAGVPAARTLAGTSLSAADLVADPDSGGEPARISLAQQHRVYTNAVACYPGRDLGIRLGRRQRISDHGVLGFAMQSSRDLGDALRIASRFHTITGTLLDFELRRSDEHLTIAMREMEPLGAAYPVAVEEMLTVLARQLLSQTTPATRAAAVTLTYAPGDAHALEALLGCAPEPGAPHTSVSLRLEDLRRPFLLSDAETAALCEARCAALLARLGGESETVAKVRRVLVEHAREAHTLERVAASLHVSPRTLRRRLAAAGTSFREVRGDVNRSLALDYLTHSSLGVDEIAELLGYAETTNFYRAFARWTGRTPAAVRRESQGANRSAVP